MHLIEGKSRHEIALELNHELDPMEVSKKADMPDHRVMTAYMKSKIYIWSTEKQNYVLLKVEQTKNNSVETTSQI